MNNISLTTHAHPLINRLQCEDTRKSIQELLNEAHKNHELPYLLATKYSSSGVKLYYDGLTLLQEVGATGKLTLSRVKEFGYTWFQEKRYSPKNKIVEFSPIYTGTPSDALVHLLGRFNPHNGFTARVDYISQLSKDIFTKIKDDKISPEIREKKIQEFHFWHNICLTEYQVLFDGGTLGYYGHAIKELIHITNTFGCHRTSINLIIKALKSTVLNKSFAELLHQILAKNRIILDDEIKKEISAVLIDYRELQLKVKIQIIWNTFNNIIALKEERDRSHNDLVYLTKLYSNAEMPKFALLKVAIKENLCSEVRDLSMELINSKNSHYSQFAKHAYASMIIFNKATDEDELNNAMKHIASVCVSNPENTKSVELLSILINRYGLHLCKLPKQADMYTKLLEFSLDRGELNEGVITALARIYSLSNLPSKEVAFLDQYIRIFPFSLNMLLLLAKAHQKNALQLEMAKSRVLSIEYFMRAIDVEPENVIANIGAAMQLLQEPSLSKEDFNYIKKCIRVIKNKFADLEPSNKGIYYCLLALLYTKPECFDLDLAINNYLFACMITDSGEFLEFTRTSVETASRSAKECLKYLI